MSFRVTRLKELRTLGFNQWSLETLDRTIGLRTDCHPVKFRPSKIVLLAPKYLGITIEGGWPVSVLHHPEIKLMAQIQNSVEGETIDLPFESSDKLVFSITSRQPDKLAVHALYHQIKAKSLADRLEEKETVIDRLVDQIAEFEARLAKIEFDATVP